MKRLLTILFFIPLLVNAQLLRYSDFENTTNFLRYLPSTSGTFFKEGSMSWSCVADNTYYVSPSRSARFELRRTDTGTDSKRAEITIDELDGNVWHDISIMLPSSGWAPDAQPQIILQAHDRHPTNACSASPPFAIETKAVGGVEHYFIRTRYSNANYCIVDNRKERDPVDLGPVTFDVWVRWIVKVVPSTSGTGEVIVWRDNNPNPVYSLTGVNTNYVGANSTFYWKTGIYKWVWANSGYGGSTSTVRVMYVDNIKVWGPASTYNEVSGFVPLGNVPPTINAGSDVTLGSGTTTFTRTATDGDLDGFITGRGWSRISGPNTPTMVSGSTTAGLSLSGMIPGVYQYRYAATDNNGATTTADILITIPATSNILPAVSVAGNPTPINYATSFTLNSDGGTDADGSIAAIKWLALSGPPCIIVNDNQASTLITGTGPGTYLFQITVTDNYGGETSATVSVTILASGIGSFNRRGTIILR